MAGFYLLYQIHSSICCNIQETSAHIHLKTKKKKLFKLLYARRHTIIAGSDKIRPFPLTIVVEEKKIKLTEKKNQPISTLEALLCITFVLNGFLAGTIICFPMKKKASKWREKTSLYQSKWTILTMKFAKHETVWFDRWPTTSTIICSPQSWTLTHSLSCWWSWKFLFSTICCRFCLMRNVWMLRTYECLTLSHLGDGKIPEKKDSSSMYYVIHGQQK